MTSDTGNESGTATAPDDPLIALVKSWGTLESAVNEKRREIKAAEDVCDYLSGQQYGIEKRMIRLITRTPQIAAQVRMLRDLLPDDYESLKKSLIQELHEIEDFYPYAAPAAERESLYDELRDGTVP